jgi:ESX-1-secreted protein regulator
MTATGMTATGMTASFREKLERLFVAVRHPDGSQYSLADVAAAVNAEGSAKLSASYLSELRSGRKDNPSIWVVSALARFFGQPIEYFLDDRDPVASRDDHGDAVVAMDRLSSDDRLRRALDSHDVRRIAMRASRLTPEDRDRVADLIERLSDEEHGDEIDF